MERRFEETRYRLSESLKKSYDLEEKLTKANERIANLETKKQYSPNGTVLQQQQYLQTIQQLQQNLAECKNFSNINLF